MRASMNPLDVWLAFDSPDDEESSHEANTFRDGEGYRVEWYHVDVGLVTKVYFDTYAEATEWLTRAGYADFSA